MAMNKSLEKAILSQLAKVFPGVIERSDSICPDHKDRDEIMSYLLDFKENGWVTFGYEFAERNGKHCLNIKIERPGMAYLDGLK